MTILPKAKNDSNDIRNDPAGDKDIAVTGFRVGDWTVEPALIRLSQNGESVRLEPKVMAVLVYLAKRPGQAISREELEGAVWAGTVVSYDALTGAIQKLRKAFNDDSRRPRFIETLSKKGYRLVAAVEPLETGDQPTLHPNDATAGILTQHRRKAFQLLGITALLAIAGALVWYAIYQQPAEVTSLNRPINSIAVLPFDNLSGDAAQQYFADGITDDITTGLAKLPGLLVIARDSAFLYRDQKLSISQIAEKLNVRYILHGSVRRVREQVRINAQLVEPTNGNLLWAETYDSSIEVVFDIQDEVSRGVASSLEVGMQTDWKQAATRRQTGSPQAYDSFLMGRYYFYLYASRDENLKAREFFEGAINHDPDYALAYAMLGWTYTYEAINGWSDDQEGSLTRGLELAQKANALDMTLPVAYFVSGFAYRGLGEYMKALVEAEKAIKYDPNYANAHLLLATLLYYAGRPEEGLKRVEQAMLINPHHPFNYSYHQGQALYILGRYDEAVEALEKAIASNPGAERVHVWLAAAHAQAGSIDDAQWEASQVLTMDPGFTLERTGKVFPFKDPADRERFIDGLRKAGFS